MMILRDLTEPRWVDLPQGVRLRVKPATTALMMAAKAGAKTALSQLDEGTLADGAMLAGLGFQALLEQIGRYAILEWEGVLDAAGAPLPVTAEAVALLMRHEDMADAFFRAVVVAQDAVAAEGNASGPVPPGTSGRVRNTAGGAKRSAPSAGASARMKRKRR